MSLFTSTAGVAEPTCADKVDSAGIGAAWQMVDETGVVEESAEKDAVVAGLIEAGKLDEDEEVDAIDGDGPGDAESEERAGEDAEVKAGTRPANLSRQFGRPEVEEGSDDEETDGMEETAVDKDGFESDKGTVDLRQLVEADSQKRSEGNRIK
jgi:hypothetical protein